MAGSRRQQILQISIRIIADEGYGNLTMRALARASGLKLGALQYHFSTREDLLRALVAFIADEIRGRLDAATQNRGPLTIRELAEFMLDDTVDEEYLTDMFWPQLWAMEQVEPLVSELLEDIYAEYLQMLENAITTAGAREPGSQGAKGGGALPHVAVGGRVSVCGQGAPLGVRQTGNARNDTWIYRRKVRRNSMTDTRSLDHQVNRFGFWCVVAVLVTGVIAMFLPLDAPAAYNAEHAERIAWLNANRGSFIAGWVNQIAAMLTLSGVFFAIAWQIRRRNGLRAILAAMVTLMSVMAFIIPKFIAVWTIPLLAETAVSGAVGAQMSDSLLLLLNVSIPFSLYTSFDYLGFWLYGVFALLVAGPLYGESMSSKITAVTLGAFGLIYQGMLIALLIGGIGATDIHSYFVGASMLLLIVVIAAAFVFKSAIAIGQGDSA